MVGDTQQLIQIISYFAKLKSQSVENAIKKMDTSEVLLNQQDDNHRCDVTSAEMVFNRTRKHTSDAVSFQAV